MSAVSVLSETCGIGGGGEQINPVAMVSPAELVGGGSHCGGSACPEVSHQVTLRSEDTQGALGFGVKDLNHRNKWQRDVAMGCRKSRWGEKGISLKTGARL